MCAAVGMCLGLLTWIFGGELPDVSRSFLILLYVSVALVAVLVAQAGLAVLRGDAWGWYALVVCSGLASLATLGVAVATWHMVGATTHDTSGAPGGLAMCVPAAFFVALLLGLPLDPPSRWHEDG